MVWKEIEGLACVSGNLVARGAFGGGAPLKQLLAALHAQRKLVDRSPIPLNEAQTQSQTHWP